MLKRLKKTDCVCRARTRGNPKYSHGICYHSGGLRPAVAERVKGKRLVREWQDFVNSGEDPDDFQG